MESLPDRWKKPSYTEREAVRLVAYWRYGGPHPGEDKKPSAWALEHAREDLAPLIREEPQPIEPAEPLPIFYANDPWLQPSPEEYWRSQRGSAGTEYWPNSLVYLKDLESFCPGLFGSAEMQAEPEKPPTKHGRSKPTKRMVAAYHEAMTLIADGWDKGPAADEAGL